MAADRGDDNNDDDVSSRYYLNRPTDVDVFILINF
jgi:hypothetical protein